MELLNVSTVRITGITTVGVVTSGTSVSATHIYGSNVTAVPVITVMDAKLGRIPHLLLQLHLKLLETSVEFPSITVTWCLVTRILGSEDINWWSFFDGGNNLVKHLVTGNAAASGVEL